MPRPSKDGSNKNAKRRSQEEKILKKALRAKNPSKKQLKKLRQSSRIKTIFPSQPADDFLVVELTEKKSLLAEKNAPDIVAWLEGFHLNTLSQRALFVGADLAAACHEYLPCKALFSDFVEAFMANCERYGFNPESGRAFYMITHASKKEMLMSKEQCVRLVEYYLAAIKSLKFDLRDFVFFLKDISFMLKPLDKEQYQVFFSHFVARTPRASKVPKYALLATQMLAVSKNIAPKATFDEMSPLLENLLGVLFERLTRYQENASNPERLRRICSHYAVMLDAMKEWDGTLKTALKKEYKLLLKGLKSELSSAKIEASYYQSLSEAGRILYL